MKQPVGFPGALLVNNTPNTLPECAMPFAWLENPGLCTPLTTIQMSFNSSSYQAPPVLLSIALNVHYQMLGVKSEEIVVTNFPMPVSDFVQQESNQATAGVMAVFALIGFSCRSVISVCLQLHSAFSCTPASSLHSAALTLLLQRCIFRRLPRTGAKQQV